MTNFIVSARKYRPTTFKTVVGQEYIVTTLKNAIRNQQVAQAFLFTGPRGVGKTTCARILAKTINCTQLTDDYEACNECESCRSFNDSVSFNVHELDAASNNSVDDIRTLVDQVRIPPQAGKYKVYIIDEVHMLSASAFNAFLKTLEEPPPYAKFILATTEKHKILPTILSRCQIFDFKRIRVEDIARHLAFVAENENIEYEPQALHIIATKSDGALRDALSIFDQLVSYGSNKITTKDVIENLNILDYEYHFKLVNAALAADTVTILLIIDEIYEKGFEGQALLSGFANHLRSLLVCKDEQTVQLLEVHENVAPDYLRQSKNCSVKFLIQALDLITQCDIQYKSATDKRFHIELTFLKLSMLNNAANVQNPPPVSQPTPESDKPSEATLNKNQQNSNTTSANTSSDVSENYQKPTAQNQPKVNGPQLLDDTQIVINVHKVIKNKTTQKSTNEIVDKPFTAQNVSEALSEFIQYLNQNGKTYETTILQNATLENVNEFTWKLVLASAAEIEAIRTIDIQTWLRNHLSNRNFSIQLVAEAKQDNSAVLTKEEKLKQFIAAHPQIIKMMKELDIQPEI